MIQPARHLLAAVLAMITVNSHASADEVIWARRSSFGGASTVSMTPSGELYCTGCNFNNFGRIPIQRGPGVSPDVARYMTPWMSTLWVVLMRVDQGNACSGDFYALSLNTHNLEHVDTSRFQCGTFDISVTEKGLGMVVSMSDSRGRRQVTEVR